MIAICIDTFINMYVKLEWPKIKVQSFLMYIVCCFFLLLWYKYFSKEPHEKCILLQYSMYLLQTYFTYLIKVHGIKLQFSPPYTTVLIFSSF